MPLTVCYHLHIKRAHHGSVLAGSNDNCYPVGT